MVAHAFSIYCEESQPSLRSITIAAKHRLVFAKPENALRLDKLADDRLDGSRGARRLMRCKRRAALRAPVHPHGAGRQSLVKTAAAAGVAEGQSVQGISPGLPFLQ